MDREPAARMRGWSRAVRGRSGIAGKGMDREPPARFSLDNAILHYHHGFRFRAEAIFMSVQRDPRGWHARGYLPHFDSPERIQHVVMRSADSLPNNLLQDLSPAEIDHVLDTQGRDALFDDPAVAIIVEKALHHFDGERYRLLGWCVMPNHIHAVVQQIEGFRMGDVVRSWKSFSARAINKMLNRSGAVWARDYFDRYVRSEGQLVDLLNYIENNPLATGLVKDARDWPFSSAAMRRR
jgi:putative transposase